LYGGRFVTPYTIGVPTGIPEALDAARAAGNPLVVGGAVRDSVLGTASKDIDIEVYGTDLNTLTSAFRARGFMVDEVGQAFGVLKVSKPGVVSDLDVAVPRRENATGAGHRDFEVAADAGMTVTEVTNRRDFTMNAILYDPAREVAVDPTGGFNDIEHGILRHVGPQFAEDPLRVLRAFQFAGRFAMTLDPMTAKLCRKLRKQYTTLPKERVREEWTKFFAKSTRPDWVCRRSRLPDGMTRCQV
jgi:tRNA nucleotidyltransferase (CCA-adding enzyme)